MALTDHAIDQIKRMIVSGELSPGERLPPEKELAASLGLSRNSLREAVKALELIRVLDVRRGDGTYVTSLEPSLLLEAIGFVLDLHHDEHLLEVFAVRRVLESHAAGLAAQFATADEIAELEAEMTSARAASDVQELVEHDVRLHRRIAEISRNQYLAGLIEGLSSQTVRARVWRGLTQADAVRRTLDEHAAIVAALGAHDVDGASALVSTHIRGVEDWVRHASSAARSSDMAPATGRSESNEPDA